MPDWDFFKRAGGSSSRPSGFGWGLQDNCERQEQALDPHRREPSRHQQHSRGREPRRHRASSHEHSQYVYRNDDPNGESDDSDEFNPNDYPKEFWAPASSTSRNHSSSQHGHSGSHSSSRESSNIPSHELSHGHGSSHGYGSSLGPLRGHLMSGGFDPNDLPSEFWEPVAHPSSRGPSRGVVRVPIGRLSGHDRSTSQGYRHNLDEYDEGSWQPIRSGQRLGNGNIPVRFFSLQSGSRHEGRRSSMGTDDMGEIRHLFNSMGMGGPRMDSGGMGSLSSMFGGIMDGPHMGPDADFFGRGSRMGPYGNVFGGRRSGRPSSNHGPGQRFGDERDIYNGRLPSGFITDQRSSSPYSHGEGRIPRAGDSFSTGPSMDIRDIPYNLSIAAGGALVSVAPHCTPLTNPPADATCTICLEGHTTSNPLVTPRVCTHPFHVTCLNDWVNSAANNATGCPVCRKSIVPEGRQLFVENTNGTWIPVHRVGQEESRRGRGPEARRAQSRRQ